MEYAVTLVHGTRLRLTRHATWVEPESPFSTILRENLNAPLHVYPFRWSGRNSVSARAEGGHLLAEHLQDVARRHPTARRFVIGHSHGGNVMIRALGVPGTPDAVDGVIALSTPFLAVSPRSFGPRLKLNLVLAAAVSVYSLRGLVTYFGQTTPGTANSTTLLLTVVSALILLALSASMNRGLQKRITAFIEQLQKDVELPSTLSPNRVLIVRASGDEASALLASVQFVGWLTTRTTQLASDVTGRMHSWFPRFPWISSAALFGASFAIISAILSPSAGPGMRAAAIGAAVLLVVPTAVLMLSLAISLVLLALLLTAYGPEFAPRAMFLDVSVESVPSGLSVIFQLPPTGEEGLRHSVTYQNRLAINFVAAWLRSTYPRPSADGSTTTAVQ
jgi:hypothetical protein